MPEKTLNELVVEMHGHARQAADAAWTLAQRIGPKIKNTDEEREVLARVQKSARAAALAATKIVDRL